MYKYEIMIGWSTEDQCFLASVPELPGCMADGKTQEEVLENINVVISEWLETAYQLGRNIPEPRENLIYV